MAALAALPAAEIADLWRAELRGVLLPAGGGGRGPASRPARTGRGAAALLPKVKGASPSPAVSPSSAPLPPSSPGDVQQPSPACSPVFATLLDGRGHADVALREVDSQAVGLDLAALRQSIDDAAPDQRAAAAAGWFGITRDAGSKRGTLDSLHRRVTSFRGAVEEIVSGQAPALLPLVRAVAREYEQLLNEMSRRYDERPSQIAKEAIADMGDGLRRAQRDVRDLRRSERDLRQRLDAAEAEAASRERCSAAADAQLQEVAHFLATGEHLLPEGYEHVFARAMRRAGRAPAAPPRESPRGSAAVPPLSIGAVPPPALPAEDEEELLLLGAKRGWADGPASDMGRLVVGLVDQVEAQQSKIGELTDMLDGGHEERRRRLDDLAELKQREAMLQSAVHEAVAAQHSAERKQRAMQESLRQLESLRRERDSLQHVNVALLDDLRLGVLERDMRQSMVDAVVIRKGIPPAPKALSTLAALGPLYAESWAASLAALKVKGADKYRTIQEKRGTPPYLWARSHASCRARTLTPLDARVFVHDVFQSRPVVEQQLNLPAGTPFDKYFHRYLSQKFNIPEMILEWGYSVMDACARYAAQDHDFAVFLRVTERTLPDSLWEHVAVQMSGLRAAMVEKERELGQRKGGGLPTQHAIGVLSAFFPRKTPERQAALQVAALQLADDSGAVQLDELLEQTPGDPSVFVQEVKRQLVQEHDELVHIVSRHLLTLTENHNADTGEVPFAALRAVLAHIDPGMDAASVAAAVWLEVNPRSDRRGSQAPRGSVAASRRGSPQGSPTRADLRPPGSPRSRSHVASNKEATEMLAWFAQEAHKKGEKGKGRGLTSPASKGPPDSAEMVMLTVRVLANALRRAAPLSSDVLSRPLSLTLPDWERLWRFEQQLLMPKQEAGKGRGNHFADFCETDSPRQHSTPALGAEAE